VIPNVQYAEREKKKKADLLRSHDFFDNSQFQRLFSAKHFTSHEHVPARLARYGKSKDFQHLKRQSQSVDDLIHAKVSLAVRDAEVARRSKHGASRNSMAFDSRHSRLRESKHAIADALEFLDIVDHIVEFLCFASLGHELEIQTGGKNAEIISVNVLDALIRRKALKSKTSSQENTDPRREKSSRQCRIEKAAPAVSSEHNSHGGVLLLNDVKSCMQLLKERMREHVGLVGSHADQNDAIRFHFNREGCRHG
jgi:hypothetical protein